MCDRHQRILGYVTDGETGETGNFSVPLSWNTKTKASSEIAKCSIMELRENRRQTRDERVRRKIN